MNTRKLASVVGMGLGVSLAVGATQAALWSFEDDDIDFILDPDTLEVKTTGSLDVGDIFLSAFEIDPYAIDGVSAIPAGQELTGIAAVQLVAISDDVPTVGTQYIFDAYDGGLNALLALGDSVTVPEGDAGEGAAIAMWFNDAPGPDGSGDIDLDLNRTTNPATNCTSLSDCIEQASLGDLLQVDGFGLDPDEIWASTQVLAGGNDIGTILNTGNSTLVSAFNFKLSNFFNAGAEVGFIDIATELDCGNPGYIADGCVQISGSGTITGGQGLSNGAIAHSDFDAQKFAVPEPSVLGLLGAGLLGFGVRSVRRKAKA